ncbi:MAG: ABC transporter ATP-binding protein [Nitrospirae bacterium]|nr:ABC transporter ATP-binding protein [Nitrospirota bacterium]
MITLNDIWKQYKLNNITHRSIREDVVNLFKHKPISNQPDGTFWALKGINFSVKKGQCLGLYGPNGSGKSTILKIIGNITSPTRGTLQINGRIAPMIQQGAGFHLDLTGRENIYVNASILGMTIKQIRKNIDAIIEFSGLDKDMIDVAVKKYSTGMYVRLAFSVAVHTEADIFLIDEILAVGDEDFKKKCMNQILHLKKSGRTLIVVTHNMDQMEAVSDRIIYINKGVIQ